MEKIEQLRHLELMKMRQSIRSFSDKPIDDGLLKSLLEVGISAASGGNLQMYSIIVVKDRARCEELCLINGNQPFIKNAAVNLVFVMDMHKMEVYTRSKKAPFTAHRSFMHFLITLEDIICSAQSVETAAWLSGIGSCYVGTAASCGAEMAKALKLPPLTYPIVILSLGYPKDEKTPRVAKLAYESMVFDETYKEMSELEINGYFERKYGDMKTAIPDNPETRKAMLCDFARALETTYSKDEAAAIVAECEERGFIWENQRRFGLHYHANDLYLMGAGIYNEMKALGIAPFNVVEEGK